MAQGVHAGHSPIRHAHELQKLAAARTRTCALAMLESSLRLQTSRLRPYVLPVGTQCRVSYCVSSNVRQQLKVHLVKALSPLYTRELYPVAARHRARENDELYDLEMAAQPQLSSSKAQPLWELYECPKRYTKWFAGI